MDKRQSTKYEVQNADNSQRIHLSFINYQLSIINCTMQAKCPLSFIRHTAHSAIYKL